MIYTAVWFTASEKIGKEVIMMIKWKDVIMMIKSPKDLIYLFIIVIYRFRFKVLFWKLEKEKKKLIKK